MTERKSGEWGQLDMFDHPKEKTKLTLEDLKFDDRPRISEEAREKMRQGGRKGGLSTLARHGKEHLSRAGRKGGEKILAYYGAEHMAEIGSRGGHALVEKFGVEYLAKIAREGRKHGS